MAKTLKHSLSRIKQMPPAGKTWTALVKYLTFAVLVSAGMFHLQSAFLMQLAAAGGDQQYSFITAQKSPAVLTRLARKEHLVDGNIETARQLYIRALDQFILYVPAWLGLAELLNDTGNTEKALAALQLLDKTPNRNNMAWRRTLLAYELDEKQILAKNLAWLADNQLSKRKDVFSLANIVWENPVELMHLFKVDMLPDILQWYIQSNEPQKAWVAWQETDKAGLSNQQSALGYVNYLLRLSKFEQAAKVWGSAFHQNDRFLYNSDLREPFTGSGFGWRINRPPGVSWSNPENGKGLTVEFNGEENTRFSLAQTVPLTPGNYVLYVSMEAVNLTTDQRPFWAVRGVQCKTSSTAEMVPPVQDKKEFKLFFTVPESCQAVTVMLQRNKSHYFDNKISGTLKIHNLGIDKVEGE